MNTGYVDRSTLAVDLHKQIVRAQSAGQPTNDRLRAFLQFVDEKVAEWERSGTFQQNLGGTSIKPFDFRVATFQIPKIFPLIPSPDDKRAHDGAFRGFGRIHCPPAFVRKPPVYDYIQSILANELSELCAIALRSAESSGGSHHVVGSLDWYADRNVDNHALHKDTMGSTLFVALHYANDAPILGAEYIYDFWPMDSHGDHPPPGSKAFWRANSPWREGAVAWPRELLHGLEHARKMIDRPSGGPVVYCQPMGKNGLITFVDELIYHATPLEGRRSPLERAKLYSTVSIGGKEHNLPIAGLWRDGDPSGNERREEYAIARSVSQERLTLPVRDGGKRRFARLWISVQPVNWTERFY